jgi:hypothetical protein
MLFIIASYEIVFVKDVLFVAIRANMDFFVALFYEDQIALVKGFVADAAEEKSHIKSPHRASFE